MKLRAKEENTHVADLPRYPDSNGDTGDEPDHGSTTGTPRWMYVFGIIVIVVVLLFVVVMMVAGGGGEHGPGRHAPSGDAGTPLASVPEGYTPPTGAHTQP
jgi:hypothetical protein